MKQARSELVLAIHPTTTGFGWVVFEGPDAPVDWGVAVAEKDKNKSSLAKVEKLVERFRPGVLVLEEFDTEVSRRRERVRKLARAIASLASTNGVKLKIVSRDEQRAVFAPAATRHEIAKIIAEQLEEYRHLMPPPRKPWTKEHRVMGLFAAAALAVVAYNH